MSGRVERHLEELMPVEIYIPIMNYSSDLCHRGLPSFNFEKQREPQLSLPPLSLSFWLYIYVHMSVYIYTFIHTYIYMMHYASESLPNKCNKQLRKQPNVYKQRTTYLSENSCALWIRTVLNLIRYLQNTCVHALSNAVRLGRAPFDIQSTYSLFYVERPLTLCNWSTHNSRWVLRWKRVTETRHLKWAIRLRCTTTQNERISCES